MGAFRFPRRRTSIRTFLVSVIGAAAMVAGLVLLRQQKQPRVEAVTDVPPGETVPATIVLERIRQAGI